MSSAHTATAALRPHSVLLALAGGPPDIDLTHLNFPGQVVCSLPTSVEPDAVLYILGYPEQLRGLPPFWGLCGRCVLVQWDEVHVKLPRVIPALNAVFYPCAFPEPEKLFSSVRKAHAFHALTESNKPLNTSLRTGVYLTPVIFDGCDRPCYKLLRCSTNLSGPTEDFCDVDHEIAETVNGLVQENFPGAATVDHVLAQIYGNFVDDAEAGGRHKQRKAKISAHSDKTKDMPGNGVLVFVTLYENAARGGSSSGSESPYTRMVWRRKTTSPSGEAEAEAKAKVEVELTPGSVLIVNLGTNREWTHETKPSALPVDVIPVRMGYVLRCSKTWARFYWETGTTVLISTPEDTETAGIPLRPPTAEDMEHLRALYVRENAACDRVEYPHPIPFSMNRGDYMAPTLHPR